MENIAFFLTFIITVVLCATLAFYIQSKYKREKLSRKKGITLYVVATIITAIVIGLFVPSSLVSLLDDLGLIQDFGHGGVAITAFLNVGVGIIMIPIGIILINWKPQKW